MFSWRSTSSFFENFVSGPILGGAFGVVRGVFGGLGKKSVSEFATEAAKTVGTATGAAGVTQAVAGELGRAAGHASGRVVRGVGDAVVSRPAKDIAEQAAIGAYHLAANAPRDIVDGAHIATGLGKTVWDALTNTTVEKFTEDGVTGMRRVTSLRPIIGQGAIPAGLALGAGFGALEGGTQADMGFIHSGQMHNMTGLGKNPNMHGRPIKMPYSYGADGNLVFAMHNLRNG